MALSVLLAVAAHAAPPPVPNAGSILQENQRPPSAPASSTNTGLSIEQSAGTAAAPRVRFAVRKIEITGNTRFSLAVLHALVADAEGKNLTLGQLEAAAGRITSYYQSHGYPLSRAVIPAQIVHNGVVRLLIIEARYGKIGLDNRSRVENSLLSRTVAPLRAGQPVEQAALDHSLLLLSDVPGVAVNATLRPGESIGTSDLDIETTNKQTITGSAGVDNYGNRYTGIARLGGALNVLDPLHHGDVLSLNALTTGTRMDYGRLSYEGLLNGIGTDLGGGYSELHYSLGDALAALDARGSAAVASLWLKQTCIRTRDVNLYAQIQYDHKQLDDNVGASDIRTDRHLDEVTGSLLGDWHDFSGVNSWTVALTQGRVGFDNAAAEQADAATARTQGAFSKWVAAVNRLQNIDQNDAVYVALSGQWSNVNLDSSEMMVAGGPYTVHAYDIGALSGDSGILGNVEWRHELGWLLSGRMQGSVFFDSQHIRIDHTAWSAGPNSATLSGVGVGLNWFGAAGASITAAIAVPVGGTSQLIGDNKSMHAWIALNLAF
jgi:hemolysin activation/secretion protein